AWSDTGVAALGSASGILPVCRVQFVDLLLRLIVAVNLEAVEGADRVADAVHYHRSRAAGDRARNLVLLPVDADDLVLVVRRVDAHVPHQPVGEAAPEAQRRVHAGVLHLADVDDRRGGRTRGGRQ